MKKSKVEMVEFPIYIGFQQGKPPVGFIRIDKETAKHLASGMVLSPAFIIDPETGDRNLMELGVVEWQNMCNYFEKIKKDKGLC